MAAETSDCPGCGVSLPVSDWPVRSRANASPACWQLYMSVVGHEFAHLPQLGALHQLTVDAYGAQHAGEQVPAIGVAFALIGLHLALDDGWSGSHVRAAHQYLADRGGEWPVFSAPPSRAALTIADVAGSPTPEEHATRVRAWATSVWEAWAPEHDHVREWADQSLTTEPRARMRQQ